MGASPRLDPYNHLIRRINQSTEGDDMVRKHVKSIIYDFKNGPQLTIEKSSLICVGLYAYFQALATQLQFETCPQGSNERKTMTWCYSKCMDTYLKALKAIGKAPMPRTRGRKPKAQGQNSASSLIADTKPTRTESVAYTPDSERIGDET